MEKSEHILKLPSPKLIVMPCSCNSMVFYGNHIAMGFLESFIKEPTLGFWHNIISCSVSEILRGDEEAKKLAG